MYLGRTKFGVKSVTVFTADRDASVSTFAHDEETSGRGTGETKAAPASTVVVAKPSRLWLWVLAAFVFQLGVWTTWIVIASHHKVQEVPLEMAAKPQQERPGTNVNVQDATDGRDVSPRRPHSTVENSGDQRGRLGEASLPSIAR